MARILVADDDMDIARLIQFQLELSGFDVRLASDGDECLKLVAKEPPDALLVDWMMPGKDGIQVVTALKSDPALRHIPVVLMTARAQQQDIQDGLAAGAAAYLVKPFPLEKLTSTLQEVLS